MLIDLSSFLDRIIEYLPIEGEVSADKLDLKGKDVSIIGPIKYKGEVFRLDGENIIQFKISYKYGEDCSRCLNYAINNVETNLYGRLFDEDNDFEEDDEEILVYKDYTIDLTDYILNQVILSLPMKSLCSPKCKGLCPTCGADLNNTNCDCENENIDPRLEVLKKFLPKN